jgi:fructokinase
MSEQTGAAICVFGEVLFDHFPDGARVLGGAPFNVAWHLQALGFAPRFVSRVGEDDEGEQVRAAMRSWGMDTGGLQTDPVRPTGRVTVRLEDGEPHYDIVDNCAWDAIEAPAGASPGLLYHGSLASRSARSSDALDRLRQTAEGVFLDVNLRPPWWHRPRLLELVRGARWVKVNRDELEQLAPEFADGTDPALAMLECCGLAGLVVTRGAEGAEVLLAGGERCEAAPERGDRVVDTVGAGDAFSAVFIAGLLSDWPAQLTLTRAQRFAAAIVGQRGATVSDRGFYREFLRDWDLANMAGEA